MHRLTSETVWTFKEKYPFLFLKTSALSLPGDWILTWVQSVAPYKPGKPLILQNSWLICKRNINLLK